MKNSDPQPPIAGPGRERFTDLVALVRAGDAEALERLVRAYEPDVRIAARVHLGMALRPYLDSMDLVQSVHRSLLSGLRGKRLDVASPAALIGLAVTMVKRKIARQWRRHRRQTRLKQPEGSADAVDTLVTLHRRHVGPESAAELRDAVERILSGFEGDDRRLLELRLDGLSTAEAAERLGKTPEALRVRLFRIRQRLDTEGILADWL
jgi:RNA polymerase sigma-70 factor (ECF subfamily)